MDVGVAFRFADGAVFIATRGICYNMSTVASDREVQGQFEDADAPVRSESTGKDGGKAPYRGQSDESDSEESEEEGWYDDEDICADFEDETRDFTKKLNAARGGGGLLSGQGTKKGPTTNISNSVLQLPKSIQVVLACTID